MAEQRVQRRLAAILAADVVGYTRLMEADEAGTLARLKSLRSDLFDPKAEQFGGRIFKNTGDGALAEFGSAIDAVQSAVEIQRALSERNADLSEADQVVLRIGISLGDVIVDGEDLYGNGVNVAARMETLAKPGGVCISGNVYEHVRGAPDLDFDDLGEHQVKNVDRPVPCYGVQRKDAGKVAAPGQATARAERPGIAVLPFANMSGDPEQEYFADGMVEDIITGLARIRWLTVIARNSSFAYKGTAPDVRKVGQDLAVRYVLEGSVRKAGERVRITAQLIDADTGGHLWADRFDGSLADVFDLQDQITAGVVAAIEPSVRQAEIERAKRKRPDSLDAYDLYLRALESAYVSAMADRTEALSLLDSALALNPGYAEAHGVAAWCLLVQYQWGGRSPEDKAAALDHAEAVMAARTDDAMSLAWAAVAKSMLAGEHDAALAMVDQALTQNPSCAVAHNACAMINNRLGRHEAGLTHAERSLRLSPFDPMRHIPENQRAVVKLASGDNEAALVGFRRALAANPDFLPSRILEAVCLVRLGRLEEARASVRRVLAASPDTRAATLFERLFIVDGAMFDDIVRDLRAAGLPE